jgi:hypothetical protein
MEALQCLKCAIWNDLLFRELAPSSTLEVEEARVSDEELDIEDISWEGLFIEDKDEEATTSMYDSD